MAREILYDKDAKIALKKGIDAVANTVKLTLGPKGKNVVLEKEFATPLITNDGVTIARAITLDNVYENMGAKLIKEASIKTNEVAGDGTTTSCLLTQNIISSGLKLCKKGANPLILKKGIFKATDAVCTKLKKISKKIAIKKQIEQIATISSQDEKIGKLVCDAIEKVSNDGIITIEESKTLETYIKTVEGMKIDSGYASSYMTTNQDKMTAEIDDCYILVTDKKINNIQEILPLLEQVIKKGVKLLIFASDFDNEVLATLVLNKLRGIVNCFAVKCPAFSSIKKAMLDDISVLTNTTTICDEVGITLSEASLEQLGRAKKVKITRDETTIIEGYGSQEKINDRIKSIKKQIESCTNDFDKEKLEERLAKLCGKIAIIYVGATTEVEMKEKKLRLEDAVSATKAAMVGGIIAGGGLSLLSCKKEVENLIKTLSGDEKLGAKIIYDMLKVPLLQICKNAGVNGNKVLKKIIKKNKNANNKLLIGYNALTSEYVDMIKSGIIDPTKVTLSALQNASSVASTILTTESLVIPTKAN